MKKLLIVSILCVICGGQIFGQDKKKEFTPETSYGIRLGGNLAKLTTTPPFEQSYLAGIEGGLVFRHLAEKNIGIQIELNYIQKGWTEMFEEEGNSYSRRLNYVELPLMTHFVFGKKGFRTFVNIGTFASLLLSESDKNELTDELITSIQQNPAKSFYYDAAIDNHIDFGLMATAGFLLQTSSGVFQIEGRFSQSWNHVFKFRKDGDLFSVSQNQVISFGIGYLLQSKPKKQPKEEE